MKSGQANPKARLHLQAVRNSAGQLLRGTIGQLLFGRTYKRTAEKSLGLQSPGRVSYSPSPWWILQWLLPRSEVEASDVFVEFGCGKGRVVLDAAKRYPFRRVVGVEVDPNLSEVARHLIERERGHLRCRDVRIETLDATEYVIPDDMTYAYLYNPFYGETFERVCANLIASLDRAPRTLRVIYLHPAHHDTLTATGRFRLVRLVHTTRLVPLARAAIYEAA
jgi:SAM-dependent methyltransferase